MDPEFTILQIRTSQPEAIAVLNGPHNEQFLVNHDSVIEEPAAKRRRETTPHVVPNEAQAVLRTDQYPFDPSLEWVFGHDDERCDFLLGSKAQGVSGRQFRISHNWKSMEVMFVNLSANGTRIVDPSTGKIVKIMARRVLLAKEQYRVYAGVIDITLGIPPRNQAQQAVYLSNLQRLKHEVEQATPSMGKMAVESSKAATPVFVGRARRFILKDVLGAGAMSIVYKAVEYETGNVFAAKIHKINRKDDSIQKSMLNETKILQRLNHVSTYSNCAASF